MKNSNNLKLALCAFITLLSVWLLAPTFWKLINPDSDKQPAWLPKTAMRLGLDLQGGIHMVLGVDLNKVIEDQLNRYSMSLTDDLKKQNIKNVSTKVLKKTNELEIVAKDNASADRAADFIAQNYSVLEYVGGTELNGITRLTGRQAAFIRERAIEQSIETIRNRIDEFGVAEPVITKLGDGNILVQFPGAKDPERLKSLIGQTAKLDFHIVPDCRGNQAGECLAQQRADLAAKIKTAEETGKYSLATFQSIAEYRERINKDLVGKIPAKTFVSFEKQNDANVLDKINLLPYLLSSENKVSGEFIQDAFVSLQPPDQFSPEEPVVAFKMSPAGAPMLGELTTTFRKHFMAITLDGLVKSAPIINSPISDSGVITQGGANFEVMNKEARDLAIVLRAGALPTSIEILEERVIGPSIGRDAVEAGKKALLIAMLVVFLFMWFYYGAYGLLANFVTLVNIALIFAVLGSLGATLTLPGIAGIVLTLGMAVDALIIIFERMREEIRAGRGASQVVELGFGQAFRTILDANVTTAIGAYILLQFGTGSIRGFALTLLVGIIINVFMSTFFAKTIFNYFIKHNNQKIALGISSKELREISA